MDAPAGWEQESPALYLHSSGVRIERRIYRNKEGWVLVPVDLDRKVLEFSPDDAGLEQAFAAFGRGVLTPAASVVSPEVQKARDAARQDEKPEEPSEDEESDEDGDEEEDDGDES
jgi:hypothetical protein